MAAFRGALMTNPDDDTQATPPATEPTPPTSGEPATPARPAPAATASAATGSEPTAPAPPPPLTADPNRPADSGWREPPWIPARPKDRRPGLAALLVGVGLIAIGLWLFLDRTLGVDLPSIQWRSLWPVVLIVIGGAILLRSLDRSR
jgi:hypothetical protein